MVVFPLGEGQAHCRSQLDARQYPALCMSRRCTHVLAEMGQACDMLLGYPFCATTQFKRSSGMTRMRCADGLSRIQQGNVLDCQRWHHPSQGWLLHRQLGRRVSQKLHNTSQSMTATQRSLHQLRVSSCGFPLGAAMLVSLPCATCSQCGRQRSS